MTVSQLDTQNRMLLKQKFSCMAAMIQCDSKFFSSSFLSKNCLKFKQREMLSVKIVWPWCRSTIFCHLHWFIELITISHCLPLPSNLVSYISYNVSSISPLISEKGQSNYLTRDLFDIRWYQGQKGISNYNHHIAHVKIVVLAIQWLKDFINPSVCEC